MPRRSSALLMILAASLLLGAFPLAATEPEPVTPTSRPVRLLRTWEETVKTAGGREYPRRVELVFDYHKGVAYENFSSLDGVSYGSRKIAQGLPSPSPVERDEAFELVRHDPELLPIFTRFNVVLEGGFVLEEEKGRPCGPGARCLHVFLLSSDRAGLIRRVVVDLAKRRLAYHVYMPELSRSVR